MTQLASSITDILSLQFNELELKVAAEVARLKAETPNPLQEV